MRIRTATKLRVHLLELGYVLQNYYCKVQLELFCDSSDSCWIVTLKKNNVKLKTMSQYSSNTEVGSGRERRQLIDTLIAPVIKIGKDSGYEIIENYDLGAGPVHVVWTIKPGSTESLPDIKLGFICITDYSESVINEVIGRAMFNLIDKLVIVVPSESMTKQVSDSIKQMPSTSMLQLRKYVTVLTPSTLVGKTNVKGRERETEVIGANGWTKNDWEWTNIKYY